MSIAYAPLPSKAARTCGMCGHVNKDARSECVFCSEPMAYTTPRRCRKSEDTLESPLFSPTQVAVTAFFGGWLAGSVAMAINFLNLKRVGAAVVSVITGFAIMIGMLMLVLRYPAMSLIPGLGWALVVMLVTFGIASGLQKPAYDAHVASGGKQAKAGYAIAVLLPIIIVSSLIGLGVIYAMINDSPI